MEAPLIDKVAWTSADFLRGPVRGIIVHFTGLGWTGMKDCAKPEELEWSDAGGLVVNPYHDTWGWANPATRAFVDELIDAIRQRHAAASAPVIAIGGSMGGQGALVYTRYSRQRVTACMAICPVCDLPYHYTERVDLPRTLHHAFASYGDIDAVMKAHSPLHLAATMPDVDYLLVHGQKDQAVAKSRHSDPLVAAMRKQGRRVEYLEPAIMAHGIPIDYATYRRTVDFVKAHLAG